MDWRATHDLDDIGRSPAAFKCAAPNPNPASIPPIGFGAPPGRPGAAIIDAAEGAGPGAGGGGAGAGAVEVDCAWSSCCLSNSFSSCIFFIIA